MTEPSETSTSYEPEHRRKAEEDLISAWRYQERLSALARAIGGSTQRFEDIVFDLLTSLSIDHANGDLLDKFAAIVGVERGALNDRRLRRFVRARILVNLSEGTPDELIAIYRRLTAPSDVRYRLHQPRGFRLTAVRDTFLDEDYADRVSAEMERVRPAGVAMTLVIARETDLSMDETAPGELGSPLATTI